MKSRRRLRRELPGTDKEFERFQRHLAERRQRS